MTKAIADVANDLAIGHITPPNARAQLYALQTMLVAMRMTNEAEPQPETLELKAQTAGTDELLPIAAKRVAEEVNTTVLLTHLQQMTVTDTDK